MAQIKLPFRYLNIAQDPLVENWKDFVPSFSKLFHLKDFHGQYLRSDIQELFLDLGLTPSRGNLWSRPPFQTPHYHTDQKIDCERFAVNWLLYGDPGITEWSYAALNHKIEDDVRPALKDTSPEFWGPWNTRPDVIAVLQKPMMMQTDIPHRINMANVSTWRISYSLRFQNNPSWKEGLEKLKHYIKF